MTDCKEILPGCKERFDIVDDHNKAQTAMIQEIYNRLFVDNGRKSYQTRMAKLETFMKAHLWLYGIVVVSLIGGLIKWVMS